MLHPRATVPRRTRALITGSFLTALLTAATAVPSAAWAVSRTGALDPSFGGDGTVTTDFSEWWDTARAVVGLPGGRVVAVGNAGRSDYTSDFGVVRYRRNGTLDPAFGTNGRTRTDFRGGSDIAYAAIAQPNGMVVVAGSAFTPTGSLPDFALARYRRDGSLDPAFGRRGKVTTDFGFHDEVRALVRQRDGKLIAAGFTEDYPMTRKMALSRYLPNGALDRSFGHGGTVVTAFGRIGSANAMVLQPDGRIVLVGTTEGSGGIDIALARYHKNGSLDSSFGTAGRVVTTFAGTSRDDAFAVLVQGNRLVVAGEGGGGLGLARYRMNGRLDPGFGTGGRVKVPGVPDTATAMVTCGTDLIVGSSRFALVRLDRRGRLRTTFGYGGVLVTDIGDVASLQALAWAPDGRLLAAGYSASPGSKFDFAVARYRISPHRCR